MPGYRQTAQTQTRYVLRGRIVTMTAPDVVIEDGRLAVDGNRIVAVLRPGESLPTGFSGSIELDTGGTVYPGLIDLHNHYAYNVLPLWKVTDRYENRSQWPREPSYVTDVSRPIRQALAKYAPTAMAIVRYVECKSLLGGTTTGQGLLTSVKGGRKIYRGAMRNVEAPSSKDLPQARTRVLDLQRREEAVIDFKDALRDTESRNAVYFYHLAEGVGEAARKHFTTLVEYDLLGRSLTAIHALGLKTEDLVKLKEAGASLVWSPLSNLLLYGQTHDPGRLKEIGVKFAIGCDWSPTGSKNLLQELKVAAFVSSQHGGSLSPYDLANAVTAQAAEVTGWQGALGTIAGGMLADLLVLQGQRDDPYEQLLAATEADVELVVVDGVGRYGDSELLAELVPQGTELWRPTERGATKAFHLQEAGSLLNDLTFADAKGDLETALDDIAAIYEKVQKMGPKTDTEDGDGQGFTLVIDDHDEHDPLTEYGDAMIVQSVPKGVMATSLPLDGPTVDARHLSNLAGQPNLPNGLAGFLADRYPSTSA